MSASPTKTGYPHTGTGRFPRHAGEPATPGTVRARAVLPNPDRIFTPGLFARVQFVSGQRPGALLIDDKAILTDQDRKYVYAVDKDGKPNARISCRAVWSTDYVVQSGLAPDDRIVVVGLQKFSTRHAGDPSRSTDGRSRRRPRPSSHGREVGAPAMDFSVFIRSADLRRGTVHRDLLPQA